MLATLNILMAIVSLVNTMGICFNDDKKKPMLITISYPSKHKPGLLVIVKFCLQLKSESEIRYHFTS